jgi:hypothetical protein
VVVELPEEKELVLHLQEAVAAVQEAQDILLPLLHFLDPQSLIQ